MSLLKKLATNKLKVLNAFPTSYDLPVHPALEFNFEEKDYHVVGPEVDKFPITFKSAATPCLVEHGVG